MRYRLAISDTVTVPIVATLQHDGKAVHHRFSLVANRIPQAEVTALLTTRDQPVADILQAHVTGWSGQTLVLDEDGKPAEFSPEALSVLLSVAGIGGVVFAAWVEANGARAKEKN